MEAINNSYQHSGDNQPMQHSTKVHTNSFIASLQPEQETLYQKHNDKMLRRTIPAVHLIEKFAFHLFILDGFALVIGRWCNPNKCLVKASVDHSLANLI